MPSITSLINKLRIEFPDFRFAPDSDFRWSPNEKTVYYGASSGDTASLLHELAHAILNHGDYTRDIELIQIERDAWNHAQSTLSPKYGVHISDDLIEDSLDTYRDWLHARSTCPDCQATGVQTKKHHYKCLVCGGVWRVNDARVCALRRYKVS